MNTKQLLNDLTNHRILEEEEAKNALNGLAAGEFSAAQMAVFMTVYMMRKITLPELKGFRDAMMELCNRVDLSAYDGMDLCGTGGDGKDTFNISTLASFVVAGTGNHVVKHGNNGVSSACGSSNLLSYFGHQFTSDEDELKRNLEEAGICFLHAPLFHPAMKNVAPIRKAIGLKTFFNMLGPMVNPSQPGKQLIGVYDLELARIYGYLYQQTAGKFTIVHALDGYDEISLTGKFKIISNKGEFLYDPKMIGFNPVKPSEIKGGTTIKSAANLFLAILEGRGTSAQNQVVVVNAAFALHTANNDLTLQQAQIIAEESLLSGAALKSFQSLLNKKISVSYN